ncbi:hypothetical protein AURANDRAFT_69000, partial [Aureococcus anophagefferens]
MATRGGKSQSAGETKTANRPEKCSQLIQRPGPFPIRTSASVSEGWEQRKSSSYRKGTDIDPDKKIRAEAVSHKWPPKSPPLFLFFEKHGHFKYMNSISQNSGYKNIRDGMYHQTYIYTWGNAKSRPFSTLDEGLTMRPYSSYGRAEGADPYGIFCPPRKLPNMRGHVVFISSETSGNVFPNAALRTRRKHGRDMFVDGGSSDEDGASEGSEGSAAAAVDDWFDGSSESDGDSSASERGSESDRSAGVNDDDEDSASQSSSSSGQPAAALKEESIAWAVALASELPGQQHGSAKRRCLVPRNLSKGFWDVIDVLDAGGSDELNKQLKELYARGKKLQGQAWDSNDADDRMAHEVYAHVKEANLNMPVLEW